MLRVFPSSGPLILKGDFPEEFLSLSGRFPRTASLRYSFTNGITGYWSPMRIGIVGSNDRAMAIGRLLRSGGHWVTFGDPSTRERAKRAAAMIGARHEIPYRQAMDSDLLVLAVPQHDVDRAVAAVGSRAGAVIVDAVEAERGNALFSGAEMLAHKLDSHRVVRALISLPQSGANVPICGDDPESKSMVDRALHACGCVTTDRGPLSHASELEAPAA
jgi:predicted dinucleotide-binding enzyme